MNWMNIKKNIFVSQLIGGNVSAAYFNRYSSEVKDSFSFIYN